MTGTRPDSYFPCSMSAVSCSAVHGRSAIRNKISLAFHKCILDQTGPPPTGVETVLYYMELTQLARVDHMTRECWSRSMLVNGFQKNCHKDGRCYY